MPGHELGMVAPHGTALAAAHDGTHSHIRVVALQRLPAAQRVPVPEHDIPPQLSRMAWPQSTVLAAGHEGTHSQRRIAVLQRCPGAQSVPAPQVGPPGHTFAMSVPPATVAGLVVGPRGAHWHAPPTQT